MAYARMSPISCGHAKVVDHVKSLAKEHNADHKIILSATQDSKKNPLNVVDKVKLAKKYFPGTNIVGATKEAPTFMHHAKLLSDSGTKHLIMVAGSDRVEEYHKILHKYNGQPDHHNFDKISVVSAGNRDPDAEGAVGMSATKLRGHAVAGEYDKFKSGLPPGPESLHKEMYTKVRAGLKLESFICYAKRLLVERNK